MSKLTGIFSMSFLWMPIFIVVIEEGQEPHAPCRRKKGQQKVSGAVASTQPDSYTPVSPAV